MTSGRNAEPRIVVRNAQRKLRVDLPSLQRFADAALAQVKGTFPRRASQLDGIREVTAVIVSNRRIARLHQDFMGISGPTDVITFQHGEIYLSSETAKRNAADFGSTLQEELRLYIVHGLLHLVGFDDTTRVVAREMERAQEQIVKALTAIR